MARKVKDGSGLVKLDAVVKFVSAAVITGKDAIAQPSLAVVGVDHSTAVAADGWVLHTARFSSPEARAAAFDGDPVAFAWSGFASDYDCSDPRAVVLRLHRLELMRLIKLARVFAEDDTIAIIWNDDPGWLMVSAHSWQGDSSGCMPASYPGRGARASFALKMDGKRLYDSLRVFPSEYVELSFVRRWLHSHQQRAFWISDSIRTEAGAVELLALVLGKVSGVDSAAAAFNIEMDALIDRGWRPDYPARADTFIAACDMDKIKVRRGRKFDYYASPSGPRMGVLDREFTGPINPGVDYRARVKLCGMLSGRGRAPARYARYARYERWAFKFMRKAGMLASPYNALYQDGQEIGRRWFLERDSFDHAERTIERLRAGYTVVGRLAMRESEASILKRESIAGAGYEQSCLEGRLINLRAHLTRLESSLTYVYGNQARDARDRGQNYGWALESCAGARAWVLARIESRARGHMSGSVDKLRLVGRVVGRLQFWVDHYRVNDDRAPDLVKRLDRMEARARYYGCKESDYASGIYWDAQEIGRAAGGEQMAEGGNIKRAPAAPAPVVAPARTIVRARLVGDSSAWGGESAEVEYIDGSHETIASAFWRAAGLYPVTYDGSRLLLTAEDLVMDRIRAIGWAFGRLNGARNRASRAGNTEDVAILEARMLRLSRAIDRLGGHESPERDSMWNGSHQAGMGVFYTVKRAPAPAPAPVVAPAGAPEAARAPAALIHRYTFYLPRYWPSSRSVGRVGFNPDWCSLRIPGVLDRRYNVWRAPARYAPVARLVGRLLAARAVAAGQLCADLVAPAGVLGAARAPGRPAGRCMVGRRIAAGRAGRSALDYTQADSGAPEEAGAGAPVGVPADSVPEYKGLTFDESAPEHKAITFDYKALTFDQIGALMARKLADEARAAIEARMLEIGKEMRAATAHCIARIEAAAPAPVVVAPAAPAWPGMDDLPLDCPVDAPEPEPAAPAGPDWSVFGEEWADWGAPAGAPQAPEDDPPDDDPDPSGGVPSIDYHARLQAAGRLVGRFNARIEEMDAQHARYKGRADDRARLMHYAEMGQSARARYQLALGRPICIGDRIFTDALDPVYDNELARLRAPADSVPGYKAITFDQPEPEAPGVRAQAEGWRASIEARPIVARKAVKHIRRRQFIWFNGALWRVLWTTDKAMQARKVGACKRPPERTNKAPVNRYTFGYRLAYGDIWLVNNEEAAAFMRLMRAARHGASKANDPVPAPTDSGAGYKTPTFDQPQPERAIALDDIQVDDRIIPYHQYSGRVQPTDCLLVVKLNRVTLKALTSFGQRCTLQRSALLERSESRWYMLRRDGIEYQIVAAPQPEAVPSPFDAAAPVSDGAALGALIEDATALEGARRAHALILRQQASPGVIARREALEAQIAHLGRQVESALAALPPDAAGTLRDYLGARDALAQACAVVCAWSVALRDAPTKDEARRIYALLIEDAYTAVQAMRIQDALYLDVSQACAGVPGRDRADARDMLRVALEPIARARGDAQRRLRMRIKADAIERWG